MLLLQIHSPVEIAGRGSGAGILHGLYSISDSLARGLHDAAVDNRWLVSAAVKKRA